MLVERNHAAALVGWRRYDASQRAQASAAYTDAVARIPQDRTAALGELEKQAASPAPTRAATVSWRSWLAALFSARAVRYAAPALALAPPGRFGL